MLHVNCSKLSKFFLQWRVLQARVLKVPSTRVKTWVTEVFFEKLGPVERVFEVPRVYFKGRRISGIMICNNSCKEYPYTKGPGGWTGGLEGLL